MYTFWILFKHNPPPASFPKHYKDSTVYRKSETNIPRNETERPQSQFLYIHVSVSDLYIPTIGAAYCAAGK